MATKWTCHFENDLHGFVESNSPDIATRSNEQSQAGSWSAKVVSSDIASFSGLSKSYRVVKNRYYKVTGYIYLVSGTLANCKIGIGGNNSGFADATLNPTSTGEWVQVTTVWSKATANGSDNVLLYCKNVTAYFDMITVEECSRIYRLDILEKIQSDLSSIATCELDSKIIDQAGDKPVIYMYADDEDFIFYPQGCLISTFDIMIIGYLVAKNDHSNVDTDLEALRQSMWDVLTNDVNFDFYVSMSRIKAIEKYIVGQLGIVIFLLSVDINRSFNIVDVETDKFITVGGQYITIGGAKIRVS